MTSPAVELYLCTRDDHELLHTLVTAYHAEDRVPHDARALGRVLGPLIDGTAGAIWLIREKQGVLGYVALCFGYSIEFGGRDAFIDEIYVAPYPGPGPKSTVSRGGGVLPHWSADGRELFYVNGDEMMVAEVETSGAFSASVPRVLFPFPQLLKIRGFPYSVDENGERFLMLKSNEAGGERPMELDVVVNWLEEIEPLAMPR